MRVLIVGCGYVGLPLVREFTRGGAKVQGFDIDREKVASLRAGRSYIEHIPSSLIREMIAGKRFEPTADFRRLREPDCIIICVPTPLTKERVTLIGLDTSLSMKQHDVERASRLDAAKNLLLQLLRDIHWESCLRIRQLCFFQTSGKLHYEIYLNIPSLA